MIRLRERTRHAADAGFTMLELLVSMGIMTVFMGMFAGAIFLLFDSSNGSQALVNANEQLNRAFQRLDTIARYAAYVSQPGQTGINTDTDWYIELGTSPRPVDAADPPTECYQLRVHHETADKTGIGRLEMRSWGQDGTTDWTQIASNISMSATAATQPFSYVPPSQGGSHATGLLTLDLTATDGDGVSNKTTNSKITFSAVNTYAGTTKAGYCPRTGPVP